MPGWWSYRHLNLTSSTEGGVNTQVDGVELYQECKPINGFNSSRCLGGEHSLCVEGHWGPLCSLCREYYYKGPDKCMPCDGIDTDGQRDGSTARDRMFLGVVPIGLRAQSGDTRSRTCYM